jgi:two-component system chemotaxis response regulator CheB
MIRVLVVDDSPVIREFLVDILGADPEIKVTGTASNGEDAIQAVEEQSPDVITMDIHMPRMSGIEATRRIMETYPTPIVIVSGSQDPAEVQTTFHAMEAGALAILEKPVGKGHPRHPDAVRELIQTVKLMSEVKVIRRWPRTPRKLLTCPVVPEVNFKKATKKIQMVAVGASTGGPPVIQTILSDLSKDFPAPILIVQHMAVGFIPGFVEWLDCQSNLSIHIATHGEQALPGHVYIAPDGLQMKADRGGKILLSRDGPENGHRPSVSCLFRSVANVYGENAVGVLLTGMGRDGAQELKLMKDEGAIAIVQDRESCVVYGMPREAVHLGAATYILSLDKIAGALTTLVNRSHKGGDE